jgi:peptide/nickel transport system substrate-binding protein
VLALTFLVACGKPAPSVPSTPPPLIPTSTRVATRTLTVCLGQEPTSLFPYGILSSAARSVLAAVFEGPINTNSYGYQPVILKRIPSLANGDAQLFPKSVYVGDEVIGANGLPVTLAPGVVVHPSGCRSDSCAIKYDGKSEIQMDQMQVTFRVLPNLTWSDGEPLTADDSLYSYHVAADPKIPGSKYVIDRTQSYEAADPTTIQWWGKPGFIDPTYFTNFWTPLPKHLWSQIPADQLLDADIASRTPVGWGPYVIQDWASGDHITLKKNVHYFRSGEGLPKFDFLTFRFTPDPQAALSALIAGQCDLLDPSIPLDGQVGLLRSMAASNQLKAAFITTPVMEQLAIGIRPSSYDNGYRPGVDRQDFFGDKRVRQAMALCLDRQKVVDTVLFGLSAVPDTYVPAEDPLYNTTVTKYPFNVEAGKQLLEQAGWRQVGDDPTAPRQAYGVTGVLDGTPLVLNYATTDATQRVQVSTILASSLAQCGIKVDVQYPDSASLYAPGPQGPLFGRAFDLAEFAIRSLGLEPPCEWYSSGEVPNLANHWVGTNISGYSNPAFDAACQAGQQALPDDSSYADAYHQTESIFAEDLPVIPLYWRVEIAASRKDLCNYELDPTAASALWNIASLDTNASCPP